MTGPRIAWAAPLLLLALAGCAEQGPPAEQSDGPGLADPPGAPMALSQCQAWYAAATLPAAAVPATRPDGWPARGDVAFVSVNGLLCDRVAVGPFERGPVSIVWDGHDDAEPPEACQAERNGPASVLNAFWVSDADLARHLRDAYGLPAAHGAFSHSTDALPGLAVHAWSWGEEGGAPSSLRVPEAPGETGQAGLSYRLFWPAGDGVGWLDLDVEGSGPATEKPVDGTLRPPMLLGGLPGGSSLLLGKWFPSTDASGSFRLFADRSCEHPSG